MNARKHFSKLPFIISLFAVSTLLLAACQPANNTSGTGVPVTGNEVGTSVSQGVSTVESVATSVAPTMQMVEPTVSSLATSVAPTVESIVPTVAAVATSAAGVVSNGQVSVANNASLGNILVDSRGFTLYTFKNDEPGGKSTCSGQCLVNWPPMLVAPGTQPSAGTGVDAAKVGSITRDDGATQVTYNNMPLYFFIKDAAAGDTKGQGVGSVWFAAVP
jgi:predicted lipoprotein with Yx(FWY)xxD motif